MRNGRLPFPSQFADITMAECDQRIADLSRQHVEEINRYWATLSVRSDDAPAVNARGMQYDLPGQGQARGISGFGANNCPARRMARLGPGKRAG